MAYNPIVIGGGTEATAQRVTIATDSTGVLSVDDNGGALTVDGTVTANLAAGTNNIGDVDILSIAAGDNNIGNVDVASSALPTGAATESTVADISSFTQNLAAAVFVDDAAWTDNASRHMNVGGVYQSAPHTVTDGDVTPFLTDVNGRLQVGGTVTVTATNLDIQSGGADLATTTQAGAIQTAVEIIDNAVHVDDAGFTLGTHSGIMMMGFAGTQSVNANDAGAIAMETDGSIHIHDGGNTITVDGTVAVTGVSTLAEQQTQTTHLATIAGDTTSIQTAVELLDNSVVVLGTATYTEATSSGLAVGAVRRDADTTLVNTTNEWGPLQMDANGRLKVEAFSGEALPVTFTGSTDVATQTTLASALTALQIMDDWDNGASDGASVSGDVAHDTGDAGEPVKIGMKAYELDGTAPQTAVAEADRVNAIGDLVGRQYVATEHPRFFHVSVDYASAQTNATIKAATGASTAIYITDIMISNGATAGNITLLDGSGGTVLFELYPAINGGVSLNLKNPIKLTDNTLLAITSTTVTTHSVFVAGFVD